jgi:hypothetical protein
MVGLIAVAMLCLFVLVVPGCQQQADEQMAEPMPPEEPPVPPDTEPAEDAEKAAPEEFSWTESPSLDAIPDGEIHGMVNGEPFEAKTIRVQQLDDQVGAQLELSNKEADSPTGILTEDTGVELRFPIEEGTAGELVVSFEDDKDFDTTDAFYWYPQGDDKGPMSMNPEWGCALHIEDWTLEQDEENEDVIGAVTGKVAITFDDEHKSWVAGTFDCIYYKW